MILIHYGEIGLKGKNRHSFEERLLNNVRKALGGSAESAKIFQKRIFVELADTRGAGEGGTGNAKPATHGSQEDAVASALRKVPGIEWFAFAQECEPEIGAIWEKVKGNLHEFEGKTFAVRTKRSDKEFPLKSMEVSGEIGSRIGEKTKSKVDLGNPQITAHIEIMKGKALVFFKKEKGFGGLPVGSAGKILCLMSGGIDSPVAAALMMKRGCEVDFLHIHPFEEKGAEKVQKSKIGKLIEILNGFQQREAKLFAIAYAGFYAQSGQVERRYELVVFRRYLYKLAEKIAKEYGYLGVVSGDALGQVASQTLENIGCAQSGLEIPVFRPLISMDKMEIVEIAEKIGTYEESIKEYTDCCSLVSVKSPVTKARRGTVEEYYEKMEIPKLIKENIEEIKKGEKKGSP
ncbi:tRNA 4-thiouridine(8) synthase ThiI [Candidatus Micrarchaeota archaeon]|nr:tRNA 4-thiouridine(8) synthase ThiI [Candidatus Micrarchaeota archaeon]